MWQWFLAYEKEYCQQQITLWITWDADILCPIDIIIGQDGHQVIDHFLNLTVTSWQEFQSASRGTHTIISLNPLPLLHHYINSCHHNIKSLDILITPNYNMISLEANTFHRLMKLWIHKIGIHVFFPPVYAEVNIKERLFSTNFGYVITL